MSDGPAANEDVYETLKSEVAKKNMSGVELIHIRNSENTIMIAKEGTMDKIKDGSFPPPPPPPREPREESESEE